MLFGEVTQDWTALGLLAVVLTSVGIFLKWYLPSRDDRFEKILAADRDTWIAQLTIEQTRSERVIANVAGQFKDAVGEFKTANNANTIAIGEVRDCLRDLQSEIRESRS